MFLYNRFHLLRSTILFLPHHRTQMCFRLLNPFLLIFLLCSSLFLLSFLNLLLCLPHIRLSPSVSSILRLPSLLNLHFRISFLLMSLSIRLSRYLHRYVLFPLSRSLNLLLRHCLLSTFRHPYISSFHLFRLPPISLLLHRLLSLFPYNCFLRLMLLFRLLLLLSFLLPLYLLLFLLLRHLLTSILFLLRLMLHCHLYPNLMHRLSMSIRLLPLYFLPLLNLFLRSQNRRLLYLSLSALCLLGLLNCLLLLIFLLRLPTLLFHYYLFRR